MNVITTEQYFGLSAEKLQEVRNEYGYTKEDCLILDDGIQVYFLDTVSRVEEYINGLSPKFEVKAILQRINGEYALITI